MADTEFIPGMGTIEDGGVVVEEGPATIEPITAGSTQSIGTVESSSGSVTVRHADGSTEQLETGSPIFQGDQLETAADGSVGVVLADGTSFSMAEGGKMVMDEMVYDPATQEGSIGIQAVEGVFTFVSGQIAKTDPDAMTLETPVATIGIRGTQVGIEVGEGGQSNVVLMEEADGFVGEVTVSNDAGLQILNNAFQGTSITTLNSAPSETFTVDQGQMLNTFGGALGSLPATEGNNANTYNQAPPEEGAAVEEADTEVTAEEAAEDQEALEEQLAEEQEAEEEIAAEDLGEEQLAEEQLTEETLGEEALTEEALGEESTAEEATTEEALAEEDAGDLENFETAAGGDEEALGEEVIATDEQDATEALSGFDSPSDEEDIGNLSNFETAAGVQDEVLGEEDTSNSMENFEQASGGEEEELSQEVTATDEQDATEALSDFDGTGQTNTEEDTGGIENFETASGGDDDAGDGGEFIPVAGDIPAATIIPEPEVLDPTPVPDPIPDPDPDPTPDPDEPPTTTPDPASPPIITRRPESVQVSEDGTQSIELEVEATGTDPVSSVQLAGLPEGSTLILGTEENAETIIVGSDPVSLSPDQLEGLQFQPPADYNTDDLDDGAFDLTVTATSERGATTEEAVPVSVASVADSVFVTAAVESVGDDSSSVALNVTADSEAQGNFETIETVTVEGIPGGAGVVLDPGDGGDPVTVDPTAEGEVLPGVTAEIVVSEEGVSTQTLTFTGDAVTLLDNDQAIIVEATEAEPTPDLSAVTVAAVSDEGGEGDADVVLNPPEIDGGGTGVEDSSIALNITAFDPDGSASVETITIGDIPFGATLSAGEVNDNGTVTLTADQLVGLTITPPEDSSEDFSLSVTAVSSDGARARETIEVAVEASADAPTLTVETAEGGQEGIFLNLDTALTDTDGSESLAVEIGNLPDGSKLLLDGVELFTATEEGASFSLTEEQLEGIQFVPPEDTDGEVFELQVTSTATDIDPDSGAVSTAESSSSFTVSVDNVVDAPVVTVSSAAGTEDTAIPLDISVEALGNNDLIQEVTISGVPEGGSLNVGTYNEEDDTWTLSVDDLDGLAVTPPPNSDVNFNLEVKAVAVDGLDQSLIDDAVATIPVTVAAQADAPTLDPQAATGDEDTAIALDIGAALTDTDGSESISSVTIAGVPNGAILSAGTDNGDGNWTLSADDLTGLTITPVADTSDDFSLTITAVSTDTDTETGIQTSATNTATLDVTVNALDDTSTVSGGGTGDEDTAIDLNLVAAMDGTTTEEITSVTVSDIPADAVLKDADGNTLEVTNGSITLTPDQLEGVTITPPADSDDNFDLSLSATDTEGDTVTGTATVAVEAVADAPDLTATSAGGAEDTEIALDIATAVSDTDGSEEIQSVTISGIPEGAALSVGEVVDGSVTLSPDQLSGLTITPPDDFNGTMDLSVASTSIEDENGDTATTTVPLSIGVSAVPDAPVFTLSPTPVSGLEDAEGIELNLGVDVPNSTETVETVSISGLGDSTLSATDAAGNTVEIPVVDGVATVAPSLVDSLVLTPDADSDDDLALEITATSTDGTATNASVPVEVVAVADAPDLTATSAGGAEDTAIALDIATAVSDTDGSEEI
ncbi:MAG: hypothetical protein HOM51_05905, partial [Rhodospirillaceae bacterium]|nr:hypothetical protein [Rhodospirillaceae bacterium]